MCGLGLAALSVNLGCHRLPPPNAQTGPPPQHSPETADATGSTTLLGAWQSGQETLEFRQDGTLLVSGNPATYQVVGQTIVVDTGAGATMFPFELSPQKLVINVSGVPVTYRRIASGATTAASTPPAEVTVPAESSSALAAAAPPAGTPPAATSDLVGKWCYVANVYANDGGRQSETCFVLNPDGSYVYHSESSSSGQYGSAWSQSDDSGTWQATDTQLTARSSSGRVFTYNLARQNHPKNNDPMLLIDGQAFVTFYQKPPW